MRILVTGGAGFIGSRLVKKLAADPNHRIWVQDTLSEQIHGKNARPPEFPANVSFHQSSVSDGNAVEALIKESRPELVLPMAAETGTGQSMDEISRYCECNVQGTAILMENLIRHASTDLKRIVLPSSRAIYGEGPWQDAQGAMVTPQLRKLTDMAEQKFLPTHQDKTLVKPLPTTESSPPSPVSIYASTKLMQEYIISQASLGRPWKTAFLRLQNVYGPGQSLKNPYTGVLSIFCSQLQKGMSLNIFEDGNIVRDFVYIDDVVHALFLASTLSELPQYSTLNIGSGVPTSILDAAKTLISLFGLPSPGFTISGDFRAGDIRHAYADISQAQKVLGWDPKVPVDQGLKNLYHWARTL